MREISHRSFLRFAKPIFFGAFFTLSACGSTHCNFFDQIFNEPGCHTYTLAAQRSPIGGGAQCAGASFSRKVRVNCPLNSGTTGQCSSALAGGGVLNVLLVPNNNAGTFMDTTGVVYSNCGALWGDFFSGFVQTVAGTYASSLTSPGDTLQCNDVSGCTLNPSQSCISGWVAGVGVAGTASLPNGTSLLACVYIDNSFQPVPPAPPSIENWTTDPLTPLVIFGDPTFTTGWKDAN